MIEQKVHKGLWPLTNLLTFKLYPRELLWSLKMKVLVALSHVLKVQRQFKAQDSFISITESVFSLNLIMLWGTYSLPTCLR